MVFLYNITMQYLEYILSFLIGCCVSLMIGVIFSLKFDGLLKILVNLFLGGVCLAVLGFFKVSYFTLNSFNSFIMGVFGLPGLVIVYYISAFL